MNDRSEKPYAEIEYAHDGTAVWDLGWHPVGHVLASGGNDHTVKFWVRNRVGDPMGSKVEVRGGGGGSVSCFLCARVLFMCCFCFFVYMSVLYQVSYVFRLSFFCFNQAMDV